MKIGICVGFPDPIGDPSVTDPIHIAAELGYDYIEMPLALLTGLSEPDFERMRQKLADERIGCECLNIFFPSTVRLTGENADKSVINEYLNRALDRAYRIGARIIVFGSSGARNIPEGFPYEKAFEQLVHALEAISGIAAGYTLQIAIESLNRKESNIIVSLTEADKLMTAVAKPNIKLLLDYYHFSIESDSTDVLKKLLREKKIIHTHFADPANRGYPNENKPEFARVFGLLRDEGYDARCSIEARLITPAAPRAEMETGLAAMRKIAG